MSTTEEHRPELSRINTLVFDVMGTVVDDEGSVHHTALSALAQVGVTDGRAEAVHDDWVGRLQRLMSDVTDGAAPWRGHRELRRVAWQQATAAAGLGEVPADVEQLAVSTVTRFAPWPDSVAALDRLRRSYTVVALSNADVSELVALSAHAGLGWHGALSGELARSYKPNPAVYELAITLLGVPRDELMMVAAHAFDLRAAAGHGMATAYIRRPTGDRPGPGDAFDLEVDGLAGLADRLLGPDPRAG